MRARIVAGFPEDPDVPQLSAAADPQVMLETFRRHLKSAPEEIYRIENCTPFRFRCRQSGSRHVLQYTLRIKEPSTGRSWDQWVTCLLYADGETSRRLEEMKALVHDMKIPESSRTFDPVGFIPNLQMLVEVFPYDRKLRSLGRVVGGELQGLDQPILSQLGPGQWRIEQRTIEPTRYRTELGAALKYTVQAREAHTARCETLRCYLKVYRNERGEESFRLLRSLSE